MAREPMPTEDDEETDVPEDTEDTAGEDEGENQATPEEQAQYEQFVENSWEIIYDKQSGDVKPGIVESLSRPDPVDALAQTTATIVAGLQNSANESGVKVSGDVLWAVGQAVFEELASVMKGKKIADLNDDQMEAAMFRAMDAYRDQVPVDQQAAQADAETLKAAEQNGTLNQILPGLNASNDNGADEGMTDEKPPPPPTRARGMKG